MLGRSSVKCSFLNASDLEALGYFRDRRHFELVNQQRLKQGRQSTVPFGPRERDLMNPMLWTLHSGHFGDQPGLVLAGIQMAPLPRSRVVVGTIRAGLGGGQTFLRVAYVDSHTGAGQVDFHLGSLPGGLDTKNLTVELMIVHRTGLESGLAGSLSEPVNPRETGKSQKGRDEFSRENLIHYVWGAFQSDKPKNVWCDPSDSSRSYGRGTQRTRRGFVVEANPGRVFAGPPPRSDWLNWDDQITFAQVGRSLTQGPPVPTQNSFHRFP